jgi:hypothetical protein
MITAGCASNTRHAVRAGPDASAEAPGTVHNAWYAKIAPLTAQERELYDLGGAAPAIPDTPTREQAYEAILKAHFFTSGGVGYAGTAPCALKGLLRLSQEPDAANAFADLTRRADLPGQMYALCGLFLTDEAHFDRAFKPYLNDQRDVAVMQGCVGTRMVVANLVRNIADGS